MRGMSVSTIVGFAIIAFFALMAVFGPLLAPYGESQVAGDVWEPFSAQFLLGTDSSAATSCRGCSGAPAHDRHRARDGAAVVRGRQALGFWPRCRRLDRPALSRAVDMLMAIPTLIFALVMLSVLPPSVLVLILIIAVLDSTRVFRLSRAVAMDVAVMDFVEAARLRGEGLGWVMSREVLPNTLPPLIAEFGLRFCFVFLFLSALSFLGLGIQPPAADWGCMVRENANAISFGRSCR